ALEASAHVGHHAVEVVAIQALLPALLEPLDQVAEAREPLAGRATETAPEQLPEGAHEIAVLEQVLGDPVQERVRARPERLPGAVPARVPVLHYSSPPPPPSPPHPSTAFGLWPGGGGPAPATSLLPRPGDFMQPHSARFTRGGGGRGESRARPLPGWR